MGQGVQEAQRACAKNHTTKSGDYSPARRRPAGRKPGPAPDYENFGGQLKAVRQHCFPELNRWLDNLPDARCQDRCTYLGRHIWWQMILTGLLRDGSRNAFDGDRNSGQMPQNVQQLCEQPWDEERLGKRQTVTCSENAKWHASRTDVAAVAQLPVFMVRRLMEMRLLDPARLLNEWWLIAIDGTLQDRGRATQNGQAQYRYVVEAKIVGPLGTMFSLMTEFRDVRDPIRDKEDCELNAFRRLAERLHAVFPKLPICLLFDGLYPVQCVFDLCKAYQWKFIATLREGRQPTAWDEAIQTMMLSPAQVLKARRDGEDGPVEQTLRWTESIAFGQHEFSVLFSGEISPVAATLWVWVTNLQLNATQVYAIANHGGRARQGIENAFNVEKNGGFGLEHAFCADDTASQNYHLIMQVAYNLSQLLVNGLLRRLTRFCRKVTDIKLIELLRSSLLSVRIDPNHTAIGQIRFCSSE